MNNEILNQMDKVIETLVSSDKYKYFLELSDKLKNNDKVTNMIKEIKQIQKKIVKLELEKKDISLYEKEIQDILTELNKIPLYIEYISIQEEINDIYQVIKNKLDNYFIEKLN